MKTLAELETELLTANRMYLEHRQNGNRKGVIDQLDRIHELDGELIEIIGNASIAYRFSLACYRLVLAESKVTYFKE